MNRSHEMTSAFLNKKPETRNQKLGWNYKLSQYHLPVGIKPY
jgi:hypothetical protein